MTWLLEFLRRLWPWRRQPKAPPRRPLDMPGPDTTVESSTGEGVPTLIEPRIEPETTPEPEFEPEPEPLAEPPVEAAAEAEPPAAPDLVSTEAPLAPVDDQAAEEDEDDDAEEEEYDDPSEPDPFISGDGPVIASEATEALQRRRAEAMELASTGEHRVYLTDAAGPGTLAEALNLLVQEGRVTAEFQDDGESEPHILYRPETL